MAVIFTNVLLFQVYILDKKKIFSLKVDQISLHFLMKNWKKNDTKSIVFPHTVDYFLCTPL